MKSHFHQVSLYTFVSNNVMRIFCNCFEGCNGHRCRHWGTENEKNIQKYNNIQNKHHIIITEILYDYKLLKDQRLPFLAQSNIKIIVHCTWESCVSDLRDQCKKFLRESLKELWNVKDLRRRRIQLN